VVPPEPQYPELEKRFIINPKEVESVWNSLNPKMEMANYA
jgi:hypothetical protein